LTRFSGLQAGRTGQSLNTWVCAAESQSCQTMASGKAMQMSTGNTYSEPARMGNPKTVMPEAKVAHAPGQTEQDSLIRIQELRRQIEEVRKSWPAHSVPAVMLQRLEDLEEQLEIELAKSKGASVCQSRP
jgi:hypothetical protein